VDSFGKFKKVIDSMGWYAHRRPLYTVFPEPPFPGDDWLAPITTLLELIEEGIGQRNCIASVAPGVIEGRMYAYKVLRPWRRSTLLLRREGKRCGPWTIVDCRAACNAVVDAALLQRINAWLEAGEAVRNPHPFFDRRGQLLFPWFE
jgi:hypothetical protein